MAQGPLCHWIAPGVPGHRRCRVAWLTNGEGIAVALRGWSGQCKDEPRHPLQDVAVAVGYALMLPFSLATRLLQAVVRDRLRIDTELSDLAAFAAGPSPHVVPIGVEEPVLIGDMRGGFLDTAIVEQARAEEVSWCRRLGIWTRLPF